VPIFRPTPVETFNHKRFGFAKGVNGCVVHRQAEGSYQF
jgi:hypothetical protein